ncbi:MAG: hypothetical protein HOO88_05755 [Kiritimatiellaceae bacterium]|nr:hypothetical protein [Kiritimatiellaceae bacterium]
MEFPFRKLLKFKNSQESLAWWEEVFGRAFPAVQPFLVPCSGTRADFYPCPDDPSIQLSVHESGKKYRAIPTGEHAEIFEDVVLDWHDVQAYRPSLDLVSDSLRSVFNLMPAAGPQLEHLDFVGRCDCNGELRHVFACFADSAPAALNAVLPHADPKKVGCVLFPSHHAGAAELLHSRGIATVPLRECLSLNKTGFSGDCPKTCSTRRPPDISNTALKTHLDHRLDKIEENVIPGAARGAATVRSASAGGKARGDLYQPKYKEAKKFIREYHKKNPAVSFCAARKKAAQHVSLSEVTLKKHINKGDFDDW